MGKFYIGQRVKVVASNVAMYEYMIGKEGIINEFDVEDEFGNPGNVGLTIDGDNEWCFLPEEITPITDSYDKISWDECLWKPTMENV